MNREESLDLLNFHIPEEKPEDEEESKLTESQKAAYKAMKSGKNLYICGPAGTGKSYLITCFDRWCRKNNKSLLICAPTGMAAKEIGGITCHRAFSLDLSPNVKEKLGPTIKKLLEVDVVLIDEISMVRLDMFDSIIRKVNQANRVRAKGFDAYMSGSNKERKEITEADWRMQPIQVVLVGDFFQLPPVLTDKDRKVLEAEDAYAQEIGNAYSFQSDYWRSYRGGFEMMRLTEVVRQKQDKPFVRALNKIRSGNMDGVKYIVDHARKYPMNDAIWLLGTKSDVLSENNEHLKKLKGNAKTYQMIKDQYFNESELVAEVDLTLKVGARVMSIINDSRADRYANGSLGTVTHLTDDIVTVKFDNGRVADFGRYKWKVYDYKFVDGRLELILKGTYEQFPLKLAYAITIHKSQGQTFEKVNVSTKSFAPGQLYVGLSRCKSLENMYISGTISDENLLVDAEVVRFNRNPKAYRFFKRAGGARPGAGRKATKKDRGPTKQKSVPVKYLEDYEKWLLEMDKKYGI